jgi:hypothetical protein
MFAPRTSQALDPIPEIQQSFAGGQRDRDHPSLLAENEYWKGVDIEIREGGSAKTRRGWSLATSTGPGGNPQGSIYFDPAGATPPVTVQVNDGKFWTWDGASQTWSRVGTTQLSNRTAKVCMVSLANRLFVFSGENDNVMSWNGTDASFTDEGNTNTDPPRGDIACVQSGRICVAGVVSTSLLTNARSYIFFSDILDGQTWDRTTNLKQVPTETDEPVTAVAAYRNEEVLVFTRNSTHDFTVTGTTVSNFTRITIETKVGCIAHKSVVVIGEDAFYLSADLNVRTIKRTIQDKSLGVSVPITHDNPNLMKRIHEVNAEDCAGVYFDNYYLLSVPLDGDPKDSDTSTNTRNSHVIAFDNLQQKQGISGPIPSCCGEWTNIPANAWVIGYFSNRQKLYFIDSADGNAKTMFSSESDNGEYPTAVIKFRALSWQSPHLDKTLHSGELQFLETFGTATVSYAKDDGVFNSHISKVISDAGSRLPISLEFTLTEGGVLAFLVMTFYRRGRSRYWQLKLTHEGGLMNLKQLTLRSFVEMYATRGI